MRLRLALLALPLLSGCASIVEGTSQNILVNTNPPGAECGLYRKGLRIASVASTPGSALVNKTKNDIWVVCEKSGYQQATYFNHSGIAAGTFGNIVLGGGIGWAIDSASGADNKYDGTVNISLIPQTASATQRLTPLPATFEGVSSVPAEPDQPPAASQSHAQAGMTPIDPPE
jgi:hypothetical protein